MISAVRQCWPQQLLTSTSFLQTPEPPDGRREIFRISKGAIIVDDGDARDGGVDGVSQRIEPDFLHLLHLRLHDGEAIENGIQASRCLVIQLHQVDAHLRNNGLKLADLNATATYAGLETVEVALYLLDVLLEAVDIVPQEAGLCSQLSNADLELRHAQLQVVDIRPQHGHVGIDTVSNGSMGFKFTADVLILAVATIDIAIFGEDGRP